MESVVKLNRKLGVGARGVVYEGFDRARGYFVAVKELAYMEPSAIDGESEDAELAAILSELSCMRAAQHQNLVQYYGARRSSIGIQIIMEYVSGGSLDYVLRRCGPLEEAVARAYTKDIVSALQYLHEEVHVCHRDVKPANILITADGRCKLADFGVAKQMDEETPGPTCCRAAYLHTAVGTPWYMAPEVINGGIEDDEEEEEGDDQKEGESEDMHRRDNVNRQADVHSMQSSGNSLEDWSNTADPGAPSPHYSSPSNSYYNPLKKILRKGRLGHRTAGYTTRADIWSVGVTVYEMLTGTRPFGAELHNPSAVLFRIANCATSPPVMPASVSASPELRNFLDLCFVYDKELRATAGELLGHPWLCTGEGSSSTSASPTTSTRAPRPGSWRDAASLRQQQQKRSRRSTGTRLSTFSPSERMCMFAEVELLDTVDLPPYPAPAPAVGFIEDDEETPRPRPPTPPGAVEPLRRLSDPSGMSAHRSAPSLNTSSSYPVTRAEHAAASSNYTAVRQRIGHSRPAQEQVPATYANHLQTNSSNSSSGPGFRTFYNAYVDLPPHRSKGGFI